MATLATKRMLLDKFKAVKGISRLDIKVSKASGKKYAITEDSEFVGMLLPDFDKGKPIFIISFLDEETGATWDAVGNYVASETVDTL